MEQLIRNRSTCICCYTVWVRNAEEKGRQPHSRVGGEWRFSEAEEHVRYCGRQRKGPGSSRAADHPSRVRSN